MIHHSLGYLLLAPPWWLAIALVALIAGAALALRWLTTRGAVAAFVIGAGIYGLGGGRAAAPLVLFFVSSSILSKLPSARGERCANPRESVRRARQVVANGVVPLIVVLGHVWARTHWPLYAPLHRLDALQDLYLASLAAVTADTWATEIGRIAGATARSLRTWKPVATGVSGAISIPGTLGSAAGALFIPLSMIGFWNLSRLDILVVVTAGFLASWTDSILGASVQAQYRSETAGEFSDRPQGEGWRREWGAGWVTNDVVNALASASGVVFAWVLMGFGAAWFGR